MNAWMHVRLASVTITMYKKWTEELEEHPTIDRKEKRRTIIHYAAIIDIHTFKHRCGSLKAELITIHPRLEFVR